MSKKDEILQEVQRLVVDETLSKADYRELLEEVESFCKASLDCLDEEGGDE